MVFKPVQAVRARGGPPGPNHGPITSELIDVECTYNKRNALYLQALIIMITYHNIITGIHHDYINDPYTRPVQVVKTVQLWS